MNTRLLGLVKSIRWHTWLALVAGLLAGYLCRGSSTGPSPETASGRQPKANDSHREAISPKGPTALYLEEISGISSGRCEELFREMAGPGGSRDPIQLQGLFARWFQLEDPQAVLGRLGPASEFPENKWTGPFFEAWAAMDYPGALAKSNKGKFSDIRALVTVRHRDPAFLKESLAFGDQSSPLARELAALGRDDPGLAQQVASRGKAENNIDQILAVTSGWASKDPQATLAWIRSLEISPRSRADALNAIFTQWIKLDPAAAKESFKTNDVAAEMRKLGGHLNEYAGILDQPDSSDFQILHSTQTDPLLDLAGLYRQLSEAPIDWSKGMIQSSIDHDGWFSADPAKSAEEATHLPEGKARDFLLSYICDQWADRSPEEAVAFAKTHGLRRPIFRDEPTPEKIRAALAASAKTFADLLGPESDSKDPQLHRLAEKWFAADPQAAAEWLLPQAGGTSTISDSARVMIDNSLGYNWAKVDARSSIQWLTNLPEGPQKQIALGSVRFEIARYSPDTAFTLTASIAEGENRTQSLQSSLVEVARKIGQPVARELLATSELSSDERVALAHVLDNPPAKPTP